MNCGCEYGARRFFTKEEKVEMLKEHKDYLENEAKGVSERIKQLHKGLVKIQDGWKHGFALGR